MKTIGLREYHANEGRRCKLLQLVFAVLAMIVITRIGQLRAMAAQITFAIPSRNCSTTAWNSAGA